MRWRRLSEEGISFAKVLRGYSLWGRRCVSLGDTSKGELGRALFWEDLVSHIKASLFCCWADNDFHLGEWPDRMYVFTRSWGLENECMDYRWARAGVGPYFWSLLSSQGQRWGGSDTWTVGVEMERSSWMWNRSWAWYLVIKWMRVEADRKIKGKSGVLETEWIECPWVPAGKLKEAVPLSDSGEAGGGSVFGMGAQSWDWAR